MRWVLLSRATRPRPRSCGAAGRIYPAAVARDGSTIAQVSPYSWNGHHEVNAYVAGVARGVARARAPGRDRRAGRDRDDLRRSQRAIDELRGRGRLDLRPRVGRRPRRGRRAVRALRRRRVQAPRRLAPAAGPGPGRHLAFARGPADARSTSTSSTSTTRSPPAPPRRPCATRGPSTPGPSTCRPSGPSRPRSHDRWSRSSSGASTRRMAAVASTAELLNRFFPGTYEVVESAVEVERVPRSDARRESSTGPRGARGAAHLPAGAAAAAARPRVGGDGLDRGPGGPDAAAEQPPAGARPDHEAGRRRRRGGARRRRHRLRRLGRSAAGAEPDPAPSRRVPRPVVAQIEPYEELVDNERGELGLVFPPAMH